MDILYTDTPYDVSKHKGLFTDTTEVSVSVVYGYGLLRIARWRSMYGLEFIRPPEEEEAN